MKSIDGDPTAIPVILLINKCDLVAEEDQMSQPFLDKFAEDHEFLAAIRVSAKSGVNIQESISRLVKEIYL